MHALPASRVSGALSATGRRPAPRGRLQMVASTAVPAEYKKVDPVGSRVVVEVDKAESTSLGGILLPTAAQVKSTRGKVVSAGKDTTLATGSAVTYSKFAGTEVTLADGKELVILKEEDVIGVLGGGPEEWDKLQPLGDRVLLQALEAAKETAGGVILASDEVERPTLGKVIAVGPGKSGEDGKATPPSLSVGATVLYSKYAGTELKNPRVEEEYVIISSADVLATVA